MMSPLAVSTYFESDAAKFDVVIFDEASQVRPFDAIGAIYRGKQLIVAGDQKQLPPTTFFDRLAVDDSTDPDEEEAENLTDFESILDVCCVKGLPRKRLRWHYRSKREPLISFSNHHFYSNELITFPSVQDADGTGAVDFEYVEDGCWKAGSSGGYNLREAEHTAQLIIEHFSRDPKKTLGVITFNQKQQLAVLDQLNFLRRHRPELDSFFDEERDDAFFVKNLENVQGDERDVIFLSMGYGRDTNNNFAMRFGPLNRQGGERRLNVAVTRAKDHVKMIASVKSHDIDLNRTKSVGARMLKHYLEYAEHGVGVLGAEATELPGDDFDSPFEREVAAELRRQGFDTRTQIGCSGFRIDLALVHPEHPGKYVLGVECDGATYHSSATVRDRDRLRQAVLESLGWHICRIWSTDWVRNPQRQIERVKDAYHAALNSPRTSSPYANSDSYVVDEQPRTTENRSFDDRFGLFGHYADIGDVSDMTITEAIRSALKTYGATQKNDLLRCVSQSLGFSRLGPRIRSAIETRLTLLTSSGGVVSRQDDVFSLPD
jgi:very-short-patch-repair endonuclease